MLLTVCAVAERCYGRMAARDEGRAVAGVADARPRMELAGQFEIGCTVELACECVGLNGA